MRKGGSTSDDGNVAIHPILGSTANDDVFTLFVLKSRGIDVDDDILSITTKTGPIVE